jgi:hypothetical protein
MPKFYLIAAATILIIQGCAVDTGSYYQEAAGEINVSTSSLEAGSLRLGAGRNSMKVISAKNNLKLLYENNSIDGSLDYCYWKSQPCPSLNNRIDVAKFALTIIQSAPSGDDLMYFHLGWIAEALSFQDAAYEYFSISKMLFNYETSGLEGKSVIGETKRGSAKNLISFCGSQYSQSSGKFSGFTSTSCPATMYRKTVDSIRKFEETF